MSWSVYPSANRDEEVFDDPFMFDVTWSPNNHVAFGYGTHFCIGANFARHELELLFGKLTRDWTNLRVITEPDVEPNHFARAVRSFELGVRPAAHSVLRVGQPIAATWRSRI